MQSKSDIRQNQMVLKRTEREEVQEKTIIKIASPSKISDYKDQFLKFRANAINLTGVT